MGMKRNRKIENGYKQIQSIGFGNPKGSKQGEAPRGGVRRSEVKRPMSNVGDESWDPFPRFFLAGGSFSSVSVVM